MKSFWAVSDLASNSLDISTANNLPSSGNSALNSSVSNGCEFGFIQFKKSGCTTCK